MGGHGRVGLVTIAYIVIVIWPFFGPLTSIGVTSGIYWVAVFLRFAFFSVFSLALGVRKTDLLWYPVAPFVVLSVTATLINRRISWRGTFYPLSKLKKVGQSPV